MTLLVKIQKLVAETAIGTPAQEMASVVLLSKVRCKIQGSAFRHNCFHGD